MAEPTRSVFEFLVDGEQKITSAFAGFGKGLKSVRDELAGLNKIGTLPELIFGPQQQQEKAKRSLTEFEEQVLSLRKTVGRQIAEYKSLQTAIRDASAPPEELQDLLDKQKELGAAIRANKEALEGMQRTQAGAGGGADDFYGYRQSVTQPLRGISMQFQRAGGYDSALAQVGQAIDSVGDFGDSMTMLGRDLQESAQSIGDFIQNLKDVKAAGGGAGGMLNSIVGGIGQFNILGGLLIANIAAWGAVFNEVERQAQQARDAVLAQLEAGKRQRALEQQTQEAVDEGDIDSASRALEQAWADWREGKAQEADILRDLAGIQEQYAALGSSFNPAERNRLGAAGQELENQLKNLFGAGGPFEDANERIQAWSAVMERVRQRANERAVSESIERNVELLAQMGGVLDDLNDTLADFGEEHAFQRRRELEDRYREDQRAEREFQKSIVSIEQDGQERRVEIAERTLKQIDDSWKDFEKQRLKAIQRLDKSIAQVGIDEQKRIGDLNKRYMEDRVKATESFLKQVERAQTDYEKARKRRVEDLNNELLDAEAANDVARFIQAERNAALDLQRMREDHQERQTEAETEFKLAQDERRAQRAEDLKAIREDAEARRQELRQQFAEEELERREAQQERLQQIQESMAEQLAEQKKQEAKSLLQLRESYEERRALEAEERAFRDARQAEDQARQADKMRVAAEKQLRELEKQQQQHYDVIHSGGVRRLEDVQRGEVAMRAEVVGSYARALAQLRQMASQYSFGNNMAAAGYSGSYNYYAASGLLAQEGAFVNKPTLVVAGEGNRPELILPLDRSKGIPADLLNQLGKAQSTFQFGDVDLGGVSPEQFQAGMQQFADAVLRFIERTTA